MGMTKDKRGFGMWIMTVIILLLGVYLIIQWNPLNKFDSIKSNVNYFFFFGIFLVFQAGIVYGYYQLGKLVSFGFKWYNFRIKRILESIHTSIEQSQFT
jgi:hypothetical protein